MYDIYMKNYVDTNGVYQTSHEFLVYSVPIATNKERAFIDPTVSVEMGKAGSFEFSISPKNPYYNSWKQMKTILRVVYDGSTIFRGRVLTIGKNEITGIKKIHCEGDLAYLLDSQHTPVKQEKRPVISIFNYLEQLIAGHNDQMLIDGEQDKTYALGEVPGNYTNATPESQRVHTDATLNFGSDSWENTMTALDNLVKQYGGYLRTRYVSEVQIRLDWLDNWFDANPNGTKQTIRVRENLINQDSSSEVNNIFTALIPLGSSQSEEVNIKGYRTDVHGNNNYILVPQIVDLYSDAQLNVGYHSKTDYQNAINNYGVIFKTQKFDNADTQEKLFNYATDFIKENYVGGLTGFTIGAVDMHHVNGSVVKYLVGDRIPVQYPDHDNRTGETPPLVTKTVTAIAIKYVLHNPEKNEYSLGIPNNLIQRKYGTNKSKKGSSGGGSKKQQEDEDIRKAMDNDRSEVGVLAWNYVINEKYNNAEYQKLLQEDPNLQYAPTVLKSTKTIIKGVLQNDPRQKQTFQTIILDGNTGEVGFMQNPALGEMARAQKSLLINGFSGKISIKELLATGQQTTPQTLMEMYSDPQKFLNFQIWKKGKLKESPQATLAAMISGEDGTISSIINKLGLDGSGLQATIIQDGLTSMLKFFNPPTVSSGTPTETAEIDGTNGKSKVGKDSNGDWQIKLNESITYQDENGNTQTRDGFVSAKDFNLPSIASFKTKMIVVDQLVAGKATISQLEAAEARIESLETDKLTTTQLKTAIANITSSLVVNHGMSISGAVQSAGPIYASNFYFGTPDGSSSLKHCLLGGRVELVEGSTDTYHIVGYDGNGDEVVFSGTFRKAAGVSSVVWGWSGGKARATIYMTDGTSQVEESPELDSYDQAGNPTWASNKKSFTQQITVYDDSDPATAVATLSGVHAFSTVESFNAGWMKAILDCEFPSTGNNNPITVKMPNNETVEGTARTRNYTLSADDDYVYLKRTDSGMNATVGRASNPAYGSGRSYGQAEAGLELDTTNKKVKRSLSSNTKEYSITATATISYDSSTHKYTAGAQSKAGTTNMQYHSVESGTEAYDAGYSAGYGDGWDGNHDIWLFEGTSGSIDPIGGSGGGLYRIGYKDKNNNRQYIQRTWECPIPNFREAPNETPGTTLGADKVYALYVSWPNSGRESLVGAWKTPSGDSHTSSYQMYIAKREPVGGRVKYTFELTTQTAWSGRYVTFYR